MQDRKQLIGYVGGVLLIFGTFLPIVSLPIVGSVNYFMNGKGDGIFVIGYAVLAIIFVALKRYTLLWIPAILSFGQLTYALITFSQKISEAESSLNGNIFGQAIVSSVHLDWAWIVLYAGAALLVVSIYTKPAAPIAKPVDG